MPPVRNLPTPKPLKTERTHEENQERAYIAASRRSDRSIEARLESAKRASEVHKKRTGRALRVTQEDVENEEMYEEEDGDLQMNFRNLAAQWYANSPEFNRKLHAYLASQSMANKNMPNNFAGNQYGSQPTGQYGGNPFLAQLVQQRIPQQNQAQSQQQQMQPPQSPPQTGHINFSTSYRQSPYPMPGQGQRAGSFSSPKDQTVSQNDATAAIAALQANRRNSMPAPSENTASPSTFTGSPLVEPRSAHPDLHHVQGETSSHASTPQALTQSPLATTVRPNMPSRQSSHSHSYSTPTNQTLNGQQYYSGQSPDYQNMFAAGGDMRQTPFYTYNPNLSRRPRSRQGGMEQTLSPESLTLTATSAPEEYGVTSATSEAFPTSFDTLPSDGLDYNWQFGDGLATPGSVSDGAGFSTDEWANFLNADALDDTTA